MCLWGGSEWGWRNGGAHDRSHSFPLRGPAPRVPATHALPLHSHPSWQDVPPERGGRHCCLGGCGLPAGAGAVRGAGQQQRGAGQHHPPPHQPAPPARAQGRAGQGRVAPILAYTSRCHVHGAKHSLHCPRRQLGSGASAHQHCRLGCCVRLVASIPMWDQTAIGPCCSLLLRWRAARRRRPPSAPSPSCRASDTSRVGNGPGARMRTALACRQCACAGDAPPS